MNQYNRRQYDSDEVTRIIRRALKLNNEDTISHEELMETAGRIGLDPQIVETAINNSFVFFCMAAYKYLTGDYLQA
jgi:hypothetical protein